MTSGNSPYPASVAGMYRDPSGQRDIGVCSQRIRASSDTATERLDNRGCRRVVDGWDERDIAAVSGTIRESSRENYYQKLLKIAGTWFLENFLQMDDAWQKKVVGSNKIFMVTRLSDCATLINLLSRSKDNQDVTVHLAKRLNSLADKNIQALDHKSLSLFAPSFGRFPKDAICKRVVGRIAKACAVSLPTASAQSLSLFASGFGEWPRDPDCGAGTAAVAAEVLKRAVSDLKLEAFKGLELANLANGFSKWPENEGCRAAVAAVAIEVSKRASDTKLKRFKGEALSNLVNAFARWPAENACHLAAAEIAAVVRKRASKKNGLEQFKEQELAMLANGFSRWPRDAICLEAISLIAAEDPKHSSTAA